MAMDKSTYIFNGNTYRKGRLVLAVVEQYVSDNHGLAKDELEERFPSTLQGSIGVISSIEEAEGKYKGKRHFVKNTIKLTNATIAVCNQWGAKNIDKFVQHAAGELGYNIDKEFEAEDEDESSMSSDRSAGLDDEERKMYLMHCNYEDDGLEGEDLLAVIAKEIASLSETIKYKIDEPTPIYLLVDRNGAPFSNWPRTAIEILSEDEGTDYIDTLEPVFEHPSGFTSLILSKTKPDYSEYLLLRTEEFNYDFAIAFYASETDDEDLWTYNFDKIAKCHGDITIIGAHSHHNGEYAIQQWSDGYYDEGVDSNPDVKEAYLGLLEGDSLKHENLTEDAFDITKYTVIKS